MTSMLNTNITAVNFDIPAGACDCHTHIFGDPRQFPFAAPRVYTPPSASIAEMQALHRALRMDRVVIVQPSVYGTDNSCTLDAIKQLGPRARGIAIIDNQTNEAQLDAMQAGGIRGIRLNLETGGETDADAARQRFHSAVQRVNDRNLHIEIYTRLSIVRAIAELVLDSPVPVVFDHFGGAQAALGVNQPGFDALLKLVRSGKAYAKISAPYRSSTRGPDHADMAPFAKALVAANPQRILWGTDWPHPSQIPGRHWAEITPFFQIDDGSILNQLPIWVPDAGQRKTILVDNPSRLYGY